jgi:hypothetical protein
VLGRRLFVATLPVIVNRPRFEPTLPLTNQPRVRQLADKGGEFHWRLRCELNLVET